MDIPAPDTAGPNDMMVALVADDDAELARALDALETLLSPVRSGSSTNVADIAPRTTASAARLCSQAVALVSTPGAHAFVEACDALDAGLSVMVFSDNMPVEQEVALKRRAAREGLLVMGPDCGTAVIAGVGLGFANVVRVGPVGIVAA